ncbi:acyl-CoA dehydrogenase family protein [Microbacterium sp. CPCC 204701]|uniref:acyl-CoA dehydrogenase family protein n=1 Tax=Microbacterium sp. CPCC 204701 TaxID=2493084 RepID=UPI000FDB4DA9|nr:acyl-CoA dehydrogenase family protein [Microbacterium sp. CPCC 204701]
MDFSFSEEQGELRAYAREFLAANLPPSRVAEIADGEGGSNPDLVNELAGLGWFDADLSFLDQAVLFEEAGYALLAGAWFMTTAFVRPLLSNDDPLARRIDAGEVRATFAWAENAGNTSVLDIVDTRAEIQADGIAFGRKILVPDAQDADVALVPLRQGDAVLLCEVALGPDVRRPLQSLDGTRRLFEIDLDGVTARPVRLVTDRLDLAALHVRVLSALSCEAVGVARRALDIAVAYAKEREQFGKIIGTYQGVSHRLSEVFKEIELARSLAYRSAWAVETGVASEATHYVLARAAKAQAGSAAVFAAEQAIQVLGGIGMTWDHPIHRWLKRAMLLSAWEGDAARHRVEIADALIARGSI